MTKDNCTIQLEYGNDLATLDVHIAEAPPEQDPITPWPQDIEASVPQPEQCWIRSMADLSYGGYQIVCEYRDGDLRLDEYLQILSGLGFQETERLMSDTNQLVHLVLENETMSVKLMPHTLSSTMTLQVLPRNP